MSTKASSKNKKSKNNRNERESVFDFDTFLRQALKQYQRGGNNDNTVSVRTSVTRTPEGSKAPPKFLSQMREDLVTRLGFIDMQEKADQHRKSRNYHLQMLAILLLVMYLFFTVYQDLIKLAGEKNDIVKERASIFLIKLNHIVTTLNAMLKPIANLPVVKPLYSFSIEALCIFIFNLKGYIQPSHIKNMTRIQWYITLSLVVGYYLTSFTKGKGIFFMDAYWTIRDTLNDTIKTTDLDKIMKDILDIYSITTNTTGSMDRMSMNTITVGHKTVKLVREVIEQFSSFLLILLLGQGLAGLRSLEWLICNWRFDANKYGKLLESKQEQLKQALDDTFSGVQEIEQNGMNRLKAIEWNH